MREKHNRYMHRAYILETVEFKSHLPYHFKQIAIVAALVVSLIIDRSSSTAIDEGLVLFV